MTFPAVSDCCGCS